MEGSSSSFSWGEVRKPVSPYDDKGDGPGPSEPSPTWDFWFGATVFGVFVGVPCLLLFGGYKVIKAAWVFIFPPEKELPEPTEVDVKLEPLPQRGGGQAPAPPPAPAPAPAPALPASGASPKMKLETVRARPGRSGGLSVP
jgi:hypothetical protein